MTTERSPDVSPRAQRSDGIRTRRAILEEAARLATVEGLDGLSLGRLADGVGMSKSGLFAHFGSKEELQLATVETASEIFDELVVEPAATAPNGVERIRALTEGFLRHVEVAVFPGGCFFASVAAELDTRSGPVRDMALAVVGEWIGMLEQAVATRRAKGCSIPRSTRPSWPSSSTPISCSRTRSSWPVATRRRSTARAVRSPIASSAPAPRPRLSPSRSAAALDLPGAAAEQRHDVAVAGDAVDVELGRADHEVDVDAALVDPRRRPRSSRRRGRSRCRARCGSPRSRRGASRRRSSRAARSVPPRRRARALRAATRPRPSPRATAACPRRASGVEPDGLPLRELDPDPVDHRPVQLERPGRGHVPVHACRIRRREHLLARDVREVAQPVDGREVGGVPHRRREEPDRQVGARAVEPDRVEATLGQAGRDALQRGRTQTPGRDRVVLVESADVGDRVPEALVGLVRPELRIDERRPADGGRGGDAPVRRAAVDDVADARQVGEDVAPGPGRVDAGERVR